MAALVVGGLLWTSSNFGGADPVTSTTALPASETSEVGETVEGSQNPAVEPPVAIGPARIVTVTAYDPEGDGTENDGDAVMSLADGNPSTSWATVRYSSRFLGGKQGVGLVVTFDGLARQALTVDVQSGPYQVDFFASDAETIPAAFADWGSPLGSTAFANDPETIVSPTPAAPARHMLILLKELGPDTSCTDQNPYRGRLGEIALVS